MGQGTSRRPPAPRHQRGSSPIWLSQPGESNLLRRVSPCNSPVPNGRQVQSSLSQKIPGLNPAFTPGWIPDGSITPSSLSQTNPSPSQGSSAAADVIPHPSNPDALPREPPNTAPTHRSSSRGTAASPLPRAPAPPSDGWRSVIENNPRLIA